MKIDCSQLSSPQENYRLQIEHQRTDELITDMSIQAWVSTISLIVYHNHYGGNFRQKSYVAFFVHTNLFFVIVVTCELRYNVHTLFPMVRLPLREMKPRSNAIDVICLILLFTLNMIWAGCDKPVLNLNSNL